MTGKLKKPKKRVDRSVLEMNAKQARAFFLKPESYCRVDLPPYFDFGRVLRPLDKLLLKSPLPTLGLKPRSVEGVNYTIYSNKDGRYAWRPFQLIHPVIYVAFVHRLTESATWNAFRNRFSDFTSYNRKSWMAGV
jgi:RNA-directed DNA polymerase